MNDENSSIIEKELKKLGYWNNLYSKDDYFGTGQTILADFAKTIIEENNISTLLELGCGQGRDSLFFTNFVSNVTSVDISENAINFVKKIKNERNLTNLDLFVHDIKKPLNFLDKSFDIVYSNLALQFFDINQLKEIFSNISEIMSNDSFFIFSTKKPGDKYFNFGKKISENSFQYKDITRYFFEKSEIKHLLEQNFKIISFEEDEHQNPDNTISAWWKILVKN
mgnify:CR=1 FL=1|tara:strand:- start:1305 stop:1976 length:672 start_codon:yes stop_codon:yes gene_type:complete